MMAKGLYSIIAYPESSNIKEICKAILGAGGEYAYILHDKDTWDSDGKDHKAGDLKKPHYHILCGWETGFPSWNKFVEICKAVDVVIVSRFKCLVRDPYSAYAYLTHSNNDKDAVDVMEDETQV